MPAFAYEALTDEGTVTRGEAHAESELDLESRLRLRGEYLIRAETVADQVEEDIRPSFRAATPPARQPRRQAQRGEQSGTRKRTDGSIKRRDLMAFTEYLWGSAQAGIPILTTLADIELQLETPRMRRITGELREAMIEEGKSLSEAMAEHPKAFSRLYVATIEAGETTGQLDYALRQLVDYLEWHREISLQIRQATLYPIIVLIVMALLIVMLLTFVYPRLLPVFASFDVELPWPTRVLMGAGDFFEAYWRWMLGGAAATFLCIRSIIRRPAGRLWWDSLKLRTPIFGKLIHELEMSRVVTYMGLFYRTGVDLLRGLSLLEEMMTNSRIARAVAQAREQIAGGESIAQAMAATHLFPTVVIRGFALGEATGKLDESLERARVYYAREVPASVRRMLTALQPLLVIVLGGILALVAMSIFLPILQIYQSLGR